MAIDLIVDEDLIGDDTNIIGTIVKPTASAAIQPLFMESLKWKANAEEMTDDLGGWLITISSVPDKSYEITIYIRQEEEEWIVDKVKMHFTSDIPEYWGKCYLFTEVDSGEVTVGPLEDLPFGKFRLATDHGTINGTFECAQ